MGCLPLNRREIGGKAMDKKIKIAGLMLFSAMMLTGCATYDGYGYHDYPYYFDEFLAPGRPCRYFHNS
jgi:predicted small secreted protein